MMRKLRPAVAFAIAALPRRPVQHAPAEVDPIAGTRIALDDTTDAAELVTPDLARLDDDGGGSGQAARQIDIRPASGDAPEA